MTKAPVPPQLVQLILKVRWISRFYVVPEVLFERHCVWKGRAISMFRLSKLNFLYFFGALVLTFLAFGYAYSKWYDDLFHWYIDKTTPRSFNLYANIECDDRIETERVAFHFFGGTQADDVFIKINKSYYVPLYGKNPMDSRYYPAPAWWYSIWVDELPASGMVYLRTSTNELLQFPFEATQQTPVVHVTRESNDVYRVEIREVRYVM